MLIIPVKEGESIDKALNRFKRKFDKTNASNVSLTSIPYGGGAYNRSEGLTPNGIFGPWA